MDMGAASSDMGVRALIKRMGRFCGRYKLDARAEHNTGTSVVYLATDLEGQRKAIKFMSDKSQFESEVRSREGLDARYFLCNLLSLSRASQISHEKFLACKYFLELRLSLPSGPTIQPPLQICCAGVRAQRQGPP